MSILENASRLALHNWQDLHLSEHLHNMECQFINSVCVYCSVYQVEKESYPQDISCAEIPKT